MSKSREKQPARTEADLRGEFYALPAEALVDRETVAAASYRSYQTIEILAIKGGGPAYRRVGRKALYRKADVVAWMESASPVENTAQLPRRASNVAPFPPGTPPRSLEHSS